MYSYKDGVEYWQFRLVSKTGAPNRGWGFDSPAIRVINRKNNINKTRKMAVIFHALKNKFFHENHGFFNDEGVKYE